MAKRNLMEALNAVPDGKQSKNPFSLDNWESFHQKGGQFNIVGMRDTVPNSVYQMSVDGFTRTLLCNTANFSRIKENYYFIHVPLALICNNAYQMLVQRTQSYSANGQHIEQFPVFNLSKVVKRCLEIASTATGSLAQKWLDIHGFNIADGALRMLDNCGLGYYGDLLQAIQSGNLTYAQAADIVDAAIGEQLDGTPAVKPSVARPAAYQCAWYNFFRNDIYDNSIDASIYNFDDVTLKVSGQSVEYDVTEARSVDDFIIGTLQLRYVPYKKDIFTASMPGTQFGAVSTVSLMDSISIDLSSNSVTTTNQTIGNGGLVAQNTHEYVGGISVLPPNSDSGEYGRLVSSYAPNEAVNVASYNEHTHTVSLTGSTGSISSGTSLFDVLSLVESQAIQKWRQKSMMAGNKTVDQFRAHHGVVPRHLVDHLPDFIGSVDNEIIVKEITSQANTLDVTEGKNNLGEIRGRGYGASDNRTFKFVSDDYGILMLVHAIVPENTYSSFGIDKGNMMVYYSDFYQSEYQNIGLEAVPKVMLDAFARYKFASLDHGTGHDDFADAYDEGCVGYAPRNYGYKQYVSKVHGMFNPSRLIVSDSFGASSIPNPTNVFGYADMQSFVLPRKDLTGTIKYNTVNSSITLPSITLSLHNLYVDPALFDSIFAVAADNDLDSDPFFSNIKFNCASMLPMSVIGLPQF